MGIVNYTLKRQDSGAFRFRAGRTVARRVFAFVSRVLALALLLISVATLSAAASEMESSAEVAQASGSGPYILNLDHLQLAQGAKGAQGGVAGGASSAPAASPTGVFLPGATSYLGLDGDGGQVTYVTPRYQGLQVRWTGDTEASDESGTAAAFTRPRAVGASFAQGAEEFEFSLGGDYGKAPKSVAGALRLTDEDELLRLGAHARISKFTLGGAFGSEVDPGDLGETLSWDAFGRYDLGALSLGLVYNYTLEPDGGKASSGGSLVPGTLQGGARYAFTPRVAVTTNLAYGSQVDEGSDDAGIAGVLGLSLDF